jgi:hypothetical protein
MGHQTAHRGRRQCSFRSTIRFQQRERDLLFERVLELLSGQAQQLPLPVVVERLLLVLELQVQPVHKLSKPCSGPKRQQKANRVSSSSFLLTLFDRLIVSNSVLQNQSIGTSS